MMDSIIKLIGDIANLLWGTPTLALVATVSIYLTIRTGVFQLRGLGTIFKKTIGQIGKKDNKTKGAMSPFAAATVALAGTVGMGNIAGVATALSVGGPGAIFWMWLFAFLGMVSKMAEVTLAVHYRNVNKDGSTYGGPMFYIEKGLGYGWLAKMVSVGLLINALTAAGGLQAHTVGRAFLNYGINPYVTCGIMAFITGITIIGGFGRVGKVCETLVPFMSVIYILGSLVLFVLNADKIPHVFGLIFGSVLAPAPAMGGFAGATIASAMRKGVSRGMLSNEAGLGTAPMVHATAQVDHPFSQGLWGAFEVFFDTLIICTATAFAILSTGALESGTSGIELTINAFGHIFSPAVAQGFLAVTILLFCLSSQIGFYVYFETAAVYLFGKGCVKYAKWIYLVPAIALAGVADVDGIWGLADIATAACSIPNLIAVLALSGVFLKLMKDWTSGEYRYATALIDESHDYIKKAR